MWLCYNCSVILSLVYRSVRPGSVTDGAGGPTDLWESGKVEKGKGRERGDGPKNTTVAMS